VKHKWFIWTLILVLGANMLIVPEVYAQPTVKELSGSYLTVDGQPNSVIMLPHSASEKEAYAAQELQEHIKLVSGADVPILHGEPGDSAIVATLTPSEISTSKVGYYPFTITVNNTTDSSAALTFTHTAPEGAPKVEIRGQDGLADGQLQLTPHFYAIIHGLVTVDDSTEYGIHNIAITMDSNGELVSNHILKVNYIETNLLRNPGIEDASFSPWWETASFFPDSTVAHTGNKSIKFTGANGSQSGYNVKLPVQPGYAYKLTFWAKMDINSPAGIRMTFSENYGEEGRRVTEESFTLTEDWEEYSVVFYNNPTSNPAQQYNWWNIYLDGAGTVWLDDFVLIELGRIEGYVVPGEPLPNIIRNGSFEEDSSWIYENGSSRLKFDDAIDGEYVLFVDQSECIGNNHPYQNALSVKKNHLYTLGFDAKRGGENPDGTIRFSLAALPTNQGLTSVSMEVTPTEEWMRYEMSFVSPSDEVFSDRYWPDFFVPGTSGFLYVDNITLHELGEATEPVESIIISKPSVKTLPDGVGNGTIVPPDMGEKPELLPPAVQTIDNNGLNIFLASSDSFSALEQVYKEDLEFLGASDGFAVRLNGNTVYIFGSNADGTLNGVYDFIESNLGVLWTRSIDIGTLYDPLPSIELVRYDYRDKSPFEIRGWHLTGTGAGGQPHSDPGTEIMMSRNKLNGKFAEFGNIQHWDWQKSIGIEPVNLGHNLHYWLRQSPTFQALSEEEQAKYWNTDINGNPNIGNGQLNFWNPDVAVAIAESVNNFLDIHDINYVGVGIEDTGSCVQKPEDELPFEYAPGKFVQPGDPKYLSTVFFTFINEVARRVKAEHPDVTLTTYAYIFTETPPLGEIEDNVSIIIAPIGEDMKLPLTDPNSSANKSIIDNMLEWTEKTNNIMVYNYYGCFLAGDDFERPIASRIKSDFQFYVENGFIGLLPEGKVDANNDLWAVNTLHLWLYSKLAWNPEADIQELTNLFAKKAYGNAAEHMLEYYRLLDETWENNYTLLRWNATLQTYIKTFYSDPVHNAKMQAALDRAWEAANDLQKQRIAPIKEAFERNTDGGGYELQEKAVAKKSDAGLETILEALNMDDPIWADAPVLEDFRDAGTLRPVEGTKTKVRLLWDEDNLYVAYENFDSRISQLKKAELNAAGTWWNADSDDVETYLSKDNPKGDPDATYRVYFGNPLAKQITYREGAKHVPEPGQWYSSAKIFDEDGTENDRWVIIQAIPFKQLGIDGPVTANTDVYGYFYRGHYSPSFINIGWGGAPVWSPAHFNKITLSDDTEAPLLPTLDMSFATEYVSLSGNAKIIGNLGINSIEVDSINFSRSAGIDGNLFIGPEADWNEVINSPVADPRSHITGDISNLESAREYLLPQFPAIPELTSKGDLVVRKNQADSIDESGAYNSITVNDKLTINIRDEDIVIVTNTLAVKGKGSIIVNKAGTGKLILYVIDTIEVAGNGYVNNDGDYNSLVIYYAGSSEISLKGNAMLCGNIFIKDADADISGNAEVKGHIVTGGNRVTIAGNGTVTGAVYVPNGKLNMSGNSKVKSIAVARSIELSGSASIIQESSIHLDFFNELAW
jgi:hypothetical protein